MQGKLEGIGCTDVEIDYDTKVATAKVPANVTDEQVAAAVNGKFSATVKS